MMLGRIIRGVGGFYYVETDGGDIYACRPRGGFRRMELRPLPGDEVIFEVTHEGDMEGSVTKILDRKNCLIRPALANVDQAMLFFSVRDPLPSFVMMDRYLLFLRDKGIPALLVFNKADIAAADEIRDIECVYGESGLPIFFVSVKSGEGLSLIESHLAGKATFLAGPSGTGKSSLINRLCPHADMEVGALSKKLSRGKNTTRHSELFAVVGHDGTWLIDTPGFTSFSVQPGTGRESLIGCYPEFDPYVRSCRFADCRHMEEPDCAVSEAVSLGRIPRARYDNYRKILAELEER